MAGAEANGAGASGATIAPQTGGVGRAFLIQRPAPGGVAVSEAPAGASLKFNFASTDARILVQDVDVVIAFPDGGRIVLPGFAFNLLSAGGDVSFTDKTQSAQELFASVSDLRLIDNPDLRTMSSSDKDDGGKPEAAPPAPPPAPPPPPAASPAKPAKVADFDKAPQEPGDHESKVPPAHFTPPSYSGAPATPAKPATVISAAISNAPSRNDDTAANAELDITLLGVAKGRVDDLPGGGQEIHGAAAVAAAATDPAFSIQQQTKHLAGTAHDDVIHAVDPTRMPSGTFERLIDIVARFPDKSFVPETATIANLPSGFAINNAEQDGDKWVIPLSKIDPHHLQIELRYVLPGDGAASGDPPSGFTLDVLFSAKDGHGGLRVYTGSQAFVVREITSEADVVTAGPGGAGKIYALNATPPGTEISAGEGNDTVYAGPGHDTLDGGGGDNLVSYVESPAGVIVDLSTGQGKSGYAEGDVLRGFTSIEGSLYADRLTGTAGDNRFYGRGGADTIIGNGGRDTVDYSASTDGVSVNLTTGVGSGGDAAGNRLIGVSDVVGSAVGANILTGSTGANRLVGGAGNDSLDGLGGADVIIAGAGDDSVSFYATESMIDAGAGADTLVMKGAATVDLTAADQTTGDTAAVSGFEHIDASALGLGVSLTATAGDNRILGGSGDDTIHGGGGFDVIEGGAGADFIDYHGSERSIDGGSGDNTLVLRAQASVDLAGADQTRDDKVLVSGFQNVDASALDALQPVTLAGSVAANRLTGGAGADRIDGGGGADVIDAGGGDDRVDYHGGEKQIDGGSGVNTLVLDISVAVDLSAADQTTGDGVVVERFTNVDASGLKEAVSIVGDAGANNFAGGAGADTLDGGGGADVVQANGGDDVVILRPGALAIDGGAGNDTLVLAAGAGVSRVDFSRAAGVDQTTGDTAAVVNFENLDAADAATSLFVLGSAEANVLTTGAGADTIDGGGGFDVIAANGGDDTVYYRGSERAISGGGGTNSLVLQVAVDIDLSRADQTIGDQVDVSDFQNVDARMMGTGQGVRLVGTTGANALFGGAGDDTIDGGGGADVIASLAGDDRVVSYGAELRIDGGAGADTLVLHQSSSVTSVNFLVPSGVDQTGGDSAIVTNFEKLDASATSSNLTVIGSGGADSIIAGSGDDVIHGGGGGDVIQAGGGDDAVDWSGNEAYLDGGAGANTLVMRSAGMIDLRAADQSLGDTAIVVNFQNIDASSLTSLQPTSLTGTDDVNLIQGGGGADTIDGAGGLDVIEAGGGADVVTYHGTEARIDGGVGSDTLVMANSSAVSVIDLSAAADQTAGDAVVVSGFENVDASSQVGALSILGSGVANMIVAGDGADTIDGGGGADNILAGGGADRVVYHGSESVIDGGAGVNTLQLLTAADINMGRSDETVGDSVNVQNFQNIDASGLNATQGVSVIGSVAANVIVTGAGADTIDGAGGADSIVSGDGADTVVYYGTETLIDGGAGVNTLVLRAAAAIDLSRADQTPGDAVTQVAGFVNVDATALSANVSIIGSAEDNILSGGAGADTIDGGGGLDTIRAGGGADTVIYRGSENVIDGGYGNDTLVLTATSAVTSADLSMPAGLDQTAGDRAIVTSFENIDASAISDPISLIGSAASNVMSGGAGADTIDGRGGYDVIFGGAGDDIVTARGGEASIDGGAGHDTLILTRSGVVTVNFSVAAGADQTSGDKTVVSDFESLDARAVGDALAVTGSSGANTILTGSGDDLIDGAGGADLIDAGAGDDVVAYHATERMIDGGADINTLLLMSAAAVDLNSVDQTSNDAVFVTNFRNVDATALGVGVSITGSAAQNRIIGGAGADTIDGGGGYDVIDAGAGNDVVTERGTENAIDGGSDSDTLILTVAGVSGIDLSVAAGADQTAGDAVRVSNFENVVATSLSDNLTILGAAGANTISSGRGDDTIDGAGGADRIDAGPGDDTVSYWGSEIALDGGGGVNTLVMKAAATVDLNTADVTRDDSTLVANFRNVDASALTTGVVLTGSGAANQIIGGAGGDTIDGFGGRDTIAGGAGDDTIVYRGAESSIDGGANLDTLRLAAAGGITSINLDVTPGQDQTAGDGVTVMNFENVDATALTGGISIQGSAAANIIRAGSGADTVDGAAGYDLVSAGDGDDRVSYWGSEQSLDGGGGVNTLIMRAAATVDLGASDQTTVDNVAVANFQNVDASALSSGVALAGSGGANIITGGAGADTIDGAGGADVIAGGGGADRIMLRGSEISLDGGDDADTIVLASGSGVAAIDLSVAAGLNQIQSASLSVTRFENVDATALSSGVGVTGSLGTNVIETGAGADTIHGGGGADVISAGAGNDLVDYWGAETSIEGGANTDTLILFAAGAAITINLASAVDQTSGDSVTVTNFENFDASATSADITFNGSSGAELIRTGSGADVIDGRGGGDTIAAGAGADSVIYYGSDASVDGGADIDTLTLGAAVSAITINLASATDQTSGDSVTVKNFENIDASAMTASATVTGSAGANLIRTGSGADTIDGGGGADTISAGDGDDSLFYYGTESSVDGGGGVNTVVLKTAVSVNLANPGVIANFQNLDATSLLAGSASYSGSTGANVIAGGGGDETIDGKGGLDRLSGGGGDDTILYYGSEQSIDGGAGNNTLRLQIAQSIDLSAADQSVGDGVVVTNFQNIDGASLSSSVSFTGSSAVNVITGGSGGDTIDGKGGADTIRAGDGNDLVTYRGGEALIDGGIGSDTLTLAVASGVTALDFTFAAGADQSSGDTTIVANFENLVATSLTTAIVVTAGGAANVISTGAGADTIQGGGGADVISAGAGNDSVDYWGTETSIDGGADVNTLVVRSLSSLSSVNLAATAGVDQTGGDAVLVQNFRHLDASAIGAALTVTGAAGIANAIKTGSGADTIDGAGGGDTIDGGAGADSIVYYASDSSVDGGANTDTLILGAAVSAITINLGSATDQTSGDSVTVQNFENIDASLMSAPVTLTGSSGANLIKTGSGADTIDGAGGGDTIDGGAGADSIVYYASDSSVDGGANTDTLILGAAVSAITINLGGATDQTSGDSVMVKNFENVDASLMSAPVMLTGSSVANLIKTGSGADTIDGAGGGDTIDGGAGADSIVYYASDSSVDGGANTDTLILGAAVSAITINLGSATDQTSGDSVTVKNFENIDASLMTAPVTLTGSSGANLIKTGSGADTIDGAGGADTIDAGGGNDFVNYYTTLNALDGGLGIDTLVLKQATTVVLANSDQTTGDLVDVRGFENIDASAITSTGLSLTGDSNANTITGGSGNDTIDGGTGVDIISGGAGDDTIYYYGVAGSTLDGGSGVNTLVLKAASNINLNAADQTTTDSVTVTNFRNIDASSIASPLNILGTASVANNIIGGSGNDTIDGFAGADVIDAKGGNDKIYYRGTESFVDGGAGNDTLQLYSSTVSVVTKVDLSRSTDQTDGDTGDVRNFENVQTSTFSVTVVGSSGANSIVALSGNDTIQGGGGADTISGGAGNDIIDYYNQGGSIDGGTDIDTLVLKGAVTVNLASADQTTGDTVTVTNFENIDASALATGVSLTGSAAANSITGGSGNDTITGGGGADTLNGAGGDDTFMVDVSSLKLPSLINGGSGANSLSLSGTGTVSGADLLASLTNIQSIDFTATGVNASLSLSGSQISQMDGGAASTLTLNINAGDSVALTDPAANYTRVDSGLTSSYTIYSDALHSTVIAHLDVINH